MEQASNDSTMNLENLHKQMVVRRALKCLKKQCQAPRLRLSKIDDLTDAIGCLRVAFDVESNYENPELDHRALSDMLEEYPGLLVTSMTIVSDSVEQGDKALSEEKYSDAIKCFTKAILAACEDPEVYIKRGKTFFKLEQYQAAISDCEMALSLEPTCFEAYKILGPIYFHLEILSFMIRKYGEALQCCPKNTEIRTKWIKAKRSFCSLLAKEVPEEPRTVEEPKDQLVPTNDHASCNEKNVS